MPKKIQKEKDRKELQFFTIEQCGYNFHLPFCIFNLLKRTLHLQTKRFHDVIILHRMRHIEVKV